MKHLLIISFLFLRQPLYSQTTDSLVVSKSELKVFLSESRLLLSQELIFRISSTPTNYRLTKKFLEHIASMDSFISLTDVDFILTQIDQTKNFVWNSSFFDSAAILDSEKISLTNDFHAISVPYFSIDRQTCIMNVGYYCGKLCGHGRLMILKKKNNSWTVYKVLGRWVS